VELMRRYSNPDFTQDLRRLLDSPSARKPRSRRRRKNHRRLNSSEVDRLVESYEQGTLLMDLALTFGIHRTTVMAHLRRRGAEARYGVIERNIEEAKRLYMEGHSLATVGRHFGVDAATVRRALIAAHVAIRPRNGWA